jgi:hypothetical protein
MHVPNAKADNRPIPAGSLELGKNASAAGLVTVHFDIILSSPFE